MNWDAIGSIAEMLGAAGVIVSLVYLSFQIRTNTQTVKAAATKDMLTDWAEFNYDLSKHPDRGEIDRMWKLDSSWDAFDEDMRTPLGWVCRSVVQRFEAEYSLHEAGILKPEVWEKHRVYCASFISLPAVSTWWEQEKEQPMYSDSFIQEISSASTHEGLTAGSINGR
jgi:hypothetical protein